jgi:hypothetical protein
MVETSFEVATSRGVERRRVHLSTEKIGAAVMVRLDRVVPEEAGELGDCNR